MADISQPTALPTPTVTVKAGRVRRVITGEDWLMRLLIGLIALGLFAVVVLPLYQILARSLQNADGQFVGLANYWTYFSTPALAASFINSLTVAALTTVFAVGLGFGFAYALTRSLMPGRQALQTIAMLPLYAPPMVLAIALIYLFGNKGLITTGFFGVLPGFDIKLYGLTGIVIAEVLYCFPQAVIILVTALRLSDARLYEAAAALRASPLRTFVTVTLPGVRFGLLSAVFVCFTLAFTDFGAPKVVGGNYNVLATDIYKQVIGQQNFVMGATVSILLLLPTVIAFIADRIVQRRQTAQFSARAVPLTPRPHSLRDRLLFVGCGLVALAILLVLGTGLFASLVTVWPYNLTLTLKHYAFKGVGGGGYEAFWNSVQMSLLTAVFGTVVVFVGAYLVEKGRGLRGMRAVIAFLAMLPVALPGLVLGLAYIFFFNMPSWSLGTISIPNPFNALYGTMAILVIANVVHFYTVAHLTATTALKQIDPEIEAAASSLRVPFYITFGRVTLPVCLPAILEIAIYFFVNAMVTVSAVIFLYSADLRLAAVAIVNMDDAGNTAAAAAMSMLIVGASIAARFIFGLLTARFYRRSQVWLKR